MDGGEDLPKGAPGEEVPRRSLPRRYEAREVESVEVAPPFDGVHRNGPDQLDRGDERPE